MLAEYHPEFVLGNGRFVEFKGFCYVTLCYSRVGGSPFFNAWAWHLLAEGKFMAAFPFSGG